MIQMGFSYGKCGSLITVYNIILFCGALQGADPAALLIVCP